MNIENGELPVAGRLAGGGAVRNRREWDLDRGADDGRDDDLFDADRRRLPADPKWTASPL